MWGFVIRMESRLNDIFTFAVTFGGVIGLKELVMYFLKKKTEERKNNAEADNMELDVAHDAMNAQKEVIITLREESSRKEAMVAEKDKKIDELYLRLREVEDKYSAVIFEKQKYELLIKDKEIEIRDLQLKLQASEYNRCDLSDNECSRRIPPRRKKMSLAVNQEKQSSKI